MARPSWHAAALLVVLLAAAVGLQAARERREPRVAAPVDSLLYIRSAYFLKRAALSYDSLVADVYWLRTVQHYGDTKRSTDPNKKYDLLYPLLDLTTSLDPRFNIAYRFGAILLAETFPGGPGRPDQSIVLLEKGLQEQPEKWEFAEDIGFVYYWWLNDYEHAAEWFRRASAMPGAPQWLVPVAAVTLAQGGSRESSRRLWQEIGRDAEADWLKAAAQQRLMQLDAMDHLDRLQTIVKEYQRRTSRVPAAWGDLFASGLLRGVPIDPAGYPYQLAPGGSDMRLDRGSPLNPLPTEPARRR